MSYREETTTMYEDDDYGYTRQATEAEAHAEWHLNSGVPMGTPGCPQDACHADDDFDPSEINGEPIDSGRFTWSAENATLSAEASDVGGVLTDPLYVRSARTGAEQAFGLDREVRDREGELLYTEFLPLDRTLQVRVQIFND
jgi:hypothetical protein